MNASLILCQLIFLSAAFKMFFNHKYRSSMKIIFMVSFIVNILITGLIYMLLTYWYHETHILHNLCLRFICNFNVYHKNFYDECDCIFSLYIVYVMCLYPPISILLMIIVHESVYIITIMITMMIIIMTIIITITILTIIKLKIDYMIQYYGIMLHSELRVDICVLSLFR